MIDGCEHRRLLPAPGPRPELSDEAVHVVARAYSYPQLLSVQLGRPLAARECASVIVTYHGDAPESPRWDELGLLRGTLHSNPLRICGGQRGLSRIGAWELCTAETLAAEREFSGLVLDAETMSPLAYLDELARIYRDRAAKDGDVYPVSLQCSRERWVHAEHIPALLDLLESREPTVPVVSTFSSRLDVGASTVGKQAAFLIDAFREGTYPPDLNSPLDDPDVAAYRAWWEQCRERLESFPPPPDAVGHPVSR